jgi:N4-gp56 family major capsid protein
MFLFDLQRFAAGGGALTNTTANYVNSYTGDVTSWSGVNTLSAEMKTYYDTELLENARPEMVHAQFGRKQSIPKGRGKSIEWRKFNTLANADKLTEGVIPTGQKLGVSNLTDTVDQYGTYVSVSDMLELTAIDPVILEANTELSASAGRTQDELVRNDLMTGTSVIYAQRVYNSALTDVTSRGTLDATAKLTPDTVNRAVTFLKKNNAPTINGDYVAIIHPSVAYDLRSSDEWLDVHKYAATSEIFEGEIGKLHGCRFIETTQAKIFRGDDLASNSRTLAINYVSGYSGAITSVTFDGGTVAEDALIGRTILINGIPAVVTDNTASTITFASTNFGSVANDTVIYPGEGAGAGLACYATLFLGKEAFGTVDVAGGGLQMIIHDKHSAGGPLDQFSTIGYKLTTNGAKILYQDRMVRVESCGAYSSTDAAN